MLGAGGPDRSLGEGLPNGVRGEGGVRRPLPAAAELPLRDQDRMRLAEGATHAKLRWSPREAAFRGEAESHLQGFEGWARGWCL